jgi:hypothetical protein
MIINLFGCNNPNGDSVLSADHAPLLKPPGEFNFTTVQVKSQTASLSWDAAHRASVYRVFYGNSPSSMSTELESCRGLNRSCSLNELQKGVSYYFKVVAYNLGGETTISTIRHVRIIAPFNLTSLITGTEANQLIINFPQDTIGAENYVIRYGTDPSNLDQSLETASSPAVIPNLIGGDLYYVVVEASNTVGDGITVVSTNKLSETPLVQLSPPNSVTTTAEPGKVNLAWSIAAGAKWYVILRKTSGGSFQQIATNVKTLNYSDTTVTNGVTYEYVVRSSNGADSEDSSSVTVRPIGNFTLSSASGITSQGASFSWGGATGADSYQVHLKTSGGSYSTVSTQTTRTYTFSTLLPGTTYVVKIVATNSITQPDTTATSNEVTFTTAPLSVSNLAANSNSSRNVTLTWTAPASATPIIYTVLRGTTSGNYTVTLTSSLTTNTYNDSTVSDGIDYYYVVIANNGTPSAPSSEVVKKPISSCGITSTNALGKTSIQVQWSTCVGADAYSVIVSTSTGDYSAAAIKGSLTAPVNSFVVTGLSSSTKYFIKINGKNSVGTGVNRFSTEVTQVTYPDPPTISVSGGSGQATLNWTAVPTATSYSVFRGTEPGVYNFEFPTTTLPKVDTGLINGQTYYYVVRSNNGYESENSAEIGVKPIASFSIGSTSVTTSTITVNWPSTLGAESYHVQYKTGTDPYGTLSNKDSGTTITGLLPGTAYDVRVYAKSTVGTNNAYAYTSTVVAKTTPAAPVISSIASTNGTIVLNWPAVTGGEQYRIYRSTTSGSFSSTPLTTVTATTYTDSAVTAGVEYFYVISAFNGTESLVSNQVSAKPLGVFTAPTLSALSSSSLKIDWVAPTGASSYRLFYKLASDLSYSAGINVSGTTYTLTGLNSGLSYQVYVEALNTEGTSGASRTSSAVSKATLPSTISSLAVTSSEAQKVSLTWTPVVGATKYHVYRGTNGASLQYIGLVNGQSASSYLDTGLSGGSVYSYSVRPHNGSVEVADSNIQSMKVIGSFSLTGASAASSTSVNLTWTSASGADGYDLYYGPTAVPLFHISDIGSSNSTTDTLTGLDPATLYYVKLQAKNSHESNIFTVMSLPLSVTTSPSAPVLSETSVSSGSISFQVANATGASSYNVYRSESSGGPYSQLASGKTASTFTDLTATNGKSWYYVVRSFNGTESVNSNEVSGQPLPAISITSIQDLSSSSVRVSWSFSESISTSGISYQLKWGTSPASLNQTETPSGSSFDLTGLSSYTTYYFQVMATSSAGTGMTVTSVVASGTTNSAPIISAISDQETPSNEAKTISVIVSDSNDVLDCSTMTVSSSDETIIASGGIIITGLTSSSCSLIMTPEGIPGSSTLSLGISDGKDSASVSFNLNVASCTVDHIGWVNGPNSLQAGQTWSSGLKVVLKSKGSDGPICDDDVTPVYLALAKDSSFQQDAQLSGVTKVIPVDGYAEFTSAGMTRAGNGFTLIASQGEVISEQSAVPFNITSSGSPNQLIWASMPSSFAGDELPSPVPSLYTADQYGNAIAPLESLGINLSIHSADGTLVSTIENSPILTSTGSHSIENTTLPTSGSYFFRASSNSLSEKDSPIFNVSSIIRGNTTTNLEMLQGPIVHTKSYEVIYPRSTLALGKNTIDGTATYKWRITATHPGAGVGAVVLIEGATEKASITLTPNTSNPTVYETTFSAPNLADAKWTISLSGNTTVSSSQLIIEQSQASRSVSYIPLSSVPSGESFIRISHSSLQNPSLSTFPTFTYDWSTLPRLESARLIMVSKGDEATVCVQLFNKSNNSSIGTELCRTGGPETYSSLEIPLASLPSSLDQIEIRSRSSSGEGHVFKTGLLLMFHGF